MVHKKYEKKPHVFIAGQSMGGTICFKLAIRNKDLYKGIILLAPALRENYEADAFMKKVAKCIGYLFPTMSTVEQSYGTGTKYDLTEIIKSDPHNYTGKVIPGTVRTILNAMEEVEKMYKLLEVPYIVFQGGVDKLVDPFAPLDLEKQSLSKDKTTIYIKGMWHSVFAEPETADILEITSDWINDRTK